MRFMDRSEASAAAFDDVHDAIQAVEGRPLKTWVAIAVWNEDGREESTVFGAGTPLGTHGYLLDAVYASAHRSSGESENGGKELEGKAFRDASDVRKFDGGRMDVVRVGGSSIGRGVFEPGWRWSEKMRPILGVDSCPLSHIGYVVQGRMHFRMDDGVELEVGAGEAIHVSPGHDAWTVGDEQCVILEIRSAASYGQPA